MNEQELFDVVNDLYETELINGDWSWANIANELDERYNLSKSGNAWRKWHSYRAKNGYGNTLAGLTDAVLEDDILGRVWSTTNLSPDQWDVDQLKTWENGSNTNFSARFRRKNLTNNFISDILDAVGPIEWDVLRLKREQDGLLFVPTLFDAHLGKLGNNISDNVYLWTLYDMLADAERRGKIGEVLFILGHDFGHTDNTGYTTTGGTPQETDDTYQNLIKRQTALAIKAVRYLAEQYPVTVMMVPGNHDRYSNVWLGELMGHVFEMHPNVKVDNSAMPRKYFQWGRTLIMSTHGNEEKMHNLVALISNEARHLWGQTRYCEVLTGHLHTRRQMVQMMDEDHGILVRHLPSLSGADNWHLLKGYLGNSRGGLSLLYDRDFGYVGDYFADLDRVIATYTLV